LNNDQAQFIAFYGNKGTLIMRDTTLTYTPQDTRPRPEDYSIFGWPKALREQYLEQFAREHPDPQPLKWNPDVESEVYALPPGYSDVSDHQANFFNSVRSRKKAVENEEFGNNAALGCHLSNYAYFKETIAVWDPAAKRIKG
jgi:hypothetical protein